MQDTTVTATAEYTAHPEMRRIWNIVFILQVGIGATNGLFLYVWGPYFYDHFSQGGGNPTAIMVIIMVLFALRQTLVALLEVPVGALADTIGRGRVVILALAARCFFFITLTAVALCTTVTASVFWASLASIGYALSYTLFNGAFSAWCVETMRERCPKVPYAWMSSRYVVYQSIGELVGAGLAVWLYLQGIPFAIFFIGAVVAYGMMAYALKKVHEPQSFRPALKQRYTISSLSKDVGSRISHGMTMARQVPAIFWLIMVYGAFMFLMSLVLHLFPVYLREISTTETFGPLWMIMTLGSLVTGLTCAKCFSWANDRWMQRTKQASARFAAYRRLIAVAGVCCAAAVVFLSLQTYLGHASLGVFIAVFFIILGSFGVIPPCFDILVNAYISQHASASRATLLSAGSMVRSVLTLVFAVPAGGLAAEQSPVGWSLPALLLLIATIGAWATMRVAEQRRQSTPTASLVIT